MPLTILNVAYPLAPVGPDAVGGAEQVLTELDAALVEQGHQSVVVACEGSVTKGTLISVPRGLGELDAAARHGAWEHCRNGIRTALDQWPIDLVHLHGIDACEYLPPPGVPALITLHLPPSWYPSAIFNLQRPSTFLHCVSRRQALACPPCSYLLPPIDNGVSTKRLFPLPMPKGNFVLCLGRICPEKGFHLAIEAARLAGVPLVLAGNLFLYPAHQHYFREQIIPRLDRHRRFIGPVGLDRKRRLLSAAKCLLVPSLVSETSSLVAMEALACGTPVVAFPSGALAEIIQDGHTGFLVKNETEMSAAIGRCHTLPTRHCRAAALSRFSLQRTIEKYFELYHRLNESESANSTWTHWSNQQPELRSSN